MLESCSAIFQGTAETTSIKPGISDICVQFQWKQHSKDLILIKRKVRVVFEGL